MQKLIDTIKEYIIRYKWLLILGALAVFFMMTTVSQCSRARTNQRIADNNITALTDTISYYKTKNGQLAAEKTLLLGDMNTLELANAKLKKQVDDLKVKNPETVVYVETVVERVKHDTTWRNVLFDTTFNKTFDFSDDYRTLKGSVWYRNTILGMSIDEDKVFTDYTIAVKDNKVYVVSSNPYVTYSGMQGITLPRYSPIWTLNIGPSISAGYDFVNKQFAPTVGVSLTFGYNILSFGKRYR